MWDLFKQGGVACHTSQLDRYDLTVIGEIRGSHTCPVLSVTSFPVDAWWQFNNLSDVKMDGQSTKKPDAETRGQLLGRRQFWGQ